MFCIHMCSCELKWGCVNTRRRRWSEEPHFFTKEDLIGSTCVALCSSLGWLRGVWVAIVNEGVTDGRKKERRKKNLFVGGGSWGSGGWEGMRM